MKALALILSLLIMHCSKSNPTNANDKDSEMHVKRQYKYIIEEKTDSSIIAYAENYYCTNNKPQEQHSRLFFKYQLKPGSLLIQEDTECHRKVYQSESSTLNGKWNYTDSLILNPDEKLEECEEPLVFSEEKGIIRASHFYEINDKEIISSEEIHYRCFFSEKNLLPILYVLYSITIDSIDIIDCNKVKVTYDEGVTDVMTASSYLGELNMHIDRSVNGVTCSVDKYDIFKKKSKEEACVYENLDELKRFSECVEAAIAL